MVPPTTPIAANTENNSPPPKVVARPRLATGVRRWLFAAAGLVCVGLAYLGVVLPGLPTTPWVLLASYCFARSSPRLERWLKRSPIFGRLLRDWDEHRGMRPRVKAVAVTLVVVVVSLSLTFRAMPGWVKVVIGAAAACGISTILFVVPTVRGPKPRQGGNS